MVCWPVVKTLTFQKDVFNPLGLCKDVFNPLGLCNPGKAIPAQKMCREHKKGFDHLLAN